MVFETFPGNPDIEVREQKASIMKIPHTRRLSEFPRNIALCVVLCLIVLAFISGLFVPFTIDAEASSDPISVSIAPTVAVRGQTVTVPVTVGDLSGREVDAYDLTLNYDAAKLTPVGGLACDADSSCLDISGTVSSSMTIVANTQISGKIIIAAFGTASLSGSGTLIKLKFSVNPQSSGTATLAWQSFVFNEGSPTSVASDGSVFIPGERKTIGDYDGDGKAEVGIHRPSGASGTAEYWYLKSGGAVGEYAAFGFGLSTDIPVPADYTGDGKADFAVFRPSDGYWYIVRSEDYSVYAFPFGISTDTPVPADYDGDGKADVAVYRASTGYWFIYRSSDDGVGAVPFGAPTDKPIPADFDGDGRTDIAVWRAKGAVGAEWWILGSVSGARGVGFGEPSDRPVPGDYTGDGTADLAFFRPGNGLWYVFKSDDLNFFAFPFGIGEDLPAPGDYDGDGKTDAAVYRSGQWFVLRSRDFGVDAVPFGGATDKPLMSLRLP